ncbi:MAG: universal stress protein [Rectinemataceae bacterium]
MKILYAVGARGGPETIRRLLALVGPGHEIYLLHVIDSGPRETLEKYLHGPRLLRHHRQPSPHEPGRMHAPPPPPLERDRPFPSPTPPQEREWPLDEAELAAGKAIIEEARLEGARAGFVIETAIRKGKPEQIIVQSARSLSCELIVILAGEGRQGRPLIGPESVGHTARFVLDHAPCDVLQVRGV